jgi:hypothetical protein
MHFQPPTARWQSDRISPSMTRLLMVECARRDRILVKVSFEGGMLCRQGPIVPIRSRDQIADLGPEPMQDARLGLAHGHGRNAKDRRHVGRRTIINNGQPEHLPGPIFKVRADQLEGAAVQLLEFRGGIVVGEIDVGVGDLQKSAEGLASAAGRWRTPFLTKVQGQ